MEETIHFGVDRSPLPLFNELQEVHWYLRLRNEGKMFSKRENTQLGLNLKGQILEMFSVSDHVISLYLIGITAKGL